MARMNLAISEELLDELRSTVPARRRSAFIAEAVREKLARLRQVRAAEASAGAWSDEGRDEPEKEIRALREGWAERLHG